jgi:hypothetical protein
MKSSNLNTLTLLLFSEILLAGCNFEGLNGDDSKQRASCIPIISMSKGEQVTYQVNRGAEQQRILLYQVSDDVISMNITETNQTTREIVFSKVTGKECPYYDTRQPINALEKYLITGQMPLKTEANIFLGNTTSQSLDVPGDNDMGPPENSETLHTTCEVNPPTETCRGYYTFEGSSFTWRTDMIIDGVAPGLGITGFDFSYNGNSLVNMQLLEWNKL